MSLKDNTISIFGDEIAPDLETQLEVMNRLNITGLELRTAWGTNVLYLSDEEAQKVKDLCDQHNIKVTCLGSPIGKSPLADPIENEMKNLERIAAVGRIVGTKNVRMFSFYPSDISTNAHYDQHLDETIERLRKLVEVAEKEDVYLLLENEKEVVGDTLERCYKIVSTIDSPRLRFIWDPANFVQVGEENQIDRYWDTLSPYIGYIHVKDAVLADGTVKPAGEGDGQFDLLVQKLNAMGYDNVLALEPHLKIAGHSTGFSGADGAEIAVNALRKLVN